MPRPMISQITVPVLVDGREVMTTFDLKDAYAREMIEDLGNAIYWMGVTVTPLTDGSTTNPILIGNEQEQEEVRANVGGMAQYNGEEFIWNGSAWQSVGKNNFGALAFKSSASGSFTPAGTVSQPSVSVDGNTTTTVNSITDVGTLPTMSVSGETLTFSPGTLPTKGSDTTVVTNTGTISVSQPTFTGTAGSVTVS